MIRVAKSKNLRKSKPSTSLLNDFELIVTKNLPAITRLSDIPVNKNQLIRFAIKAIRHTPELTRCSKLSIVKSILEALHLGLNPDGLLGEAYIVPYGDEATLIVGYRGLIKLAKNTGKVNHIEARIAYEKDRLEVEYGTDPKITHVPTPVDDPGGPIAVYAVAYLSSGDKVFDLMWRREVLKIKEMALEKKKNKEASPWIRFEPEMWKKTVVRRLVKYLSLSPEVNRVISVDEYREAGINIDTGIEIEEVDLKEEPDDNSSDETNKEEKKKEESSKNEKEQNVEMQSGKESESTESPDSKKGERPIEALLSPTKK